MQEAIPHEITEAYAISPDSGISVLSGGLINVTLLVEPEVGDRSVLQRLKPIFEPEMMEDYKVVSEHLQSEGWEIPSLRETVTGSLSAVDSEDNLWRSFQFIDSDGQSEPGEVQLAEYGTVLGQLHQSLATLNYQPVFGLPHYHDTDHYADTLEKASVDLSTGPKRIGKSVLAYYRRLPRLLDENMQLIHSDPKINNILQRNGEPFTFVDWDGLMQGSTWIDVGDMVRSISKNSFQQTGEIPEAGLLDLIDGYREAVDPDSDDTMFQRKALSAGRLIGTALTMRYIADYHDGETGYFEWDADSYANRHAHNMDRALLQFDAVKALGSLEESL